MILRLSSLLLVILLVACSPRPEPLPAPEQPQATPISQPQPVTIFFPMVGRSWPEMPTTARGIGVAFAATAEQIDSVGAGWWHDWTVRPIVPAVQATFVPTVWGGFAYEFTALEAMCERGFQGPLMVLNEPDRPDQADMTPTDAVAVFEQVMAICPDVWLVGPRVSHADWERGFPWTREFWSLWLAEHGHLPPATPAIHGYMTAAGWRRYLADYQALLREFDWPADTVAWVPEWNVPCADGRSPDDQARLFEEAMALLEASPLVGYHSPFVLHMGRGYWPNLECAELVDENGRLTAVGEIYRGGAGVVAYP